MVMRHSPILSKSRIALALCLVDASMGYTTDWAKGGIARIDLGSRITRPIMGGRGPFPPARNL